MVILISPCSEPPAFNLLCFDNKRCQSLSISSPSSFILEEAQTILISNSCFRERSQIQCLIIDWKVLIIRFIRQPSNPSTPIVDRCARLVLTWIDIRYFFNNPLPIFLIFNTVKAAFNVQIASAVPPSLKRGIFLCSKRKKGSQLQS